MKRTGSARGNSRSNASWTRRGGQRAQFVICIIDSEPDLEPRKIYRVVPDASAAKSKHLRIIDESGEGYLYPASYFVKVALPQGAKRAWLVAR